MRSIYNVAVAAVMTVASVLAIVGGSTAVASAAPANCTIVAAGSQAPTGIAVHNYVGNYVLNGSSLTAKFTVSGSASCKETVTFVSWKATDGTFKYPITGQTQYNHVTATYGVGTHTISVPIPDCYFQADLLVGASTTAPDGTPNYTAGQLRGWVQGGSGSCTQPTPVTPVAPTNVTPVNVVQPTTLVNTGPGQVIGLFGATTLAGAVAHKLYSRRRLSRQS